jgi:hypothetical protein
MKWYSTALFTTFKQYTCLGDMYWNRDETWNKYIIDSWKTWRINMEVLISLRSERYCEWKLTSILASQWTICWAVSCMSIHKEHIGGILLSWWRSTLNFLKDIWQDRNTYFYGKAIQEAKEYPQKVVLHCGSCHHSASK